jgi:hypothetical protein
MTNRHTKPLVNGIYNNDQSPFNNFTTRNLNPVSVLPIAVVSNLAKTSAANDNDADVVIDLLPSNLTFEEFVTLFYNNSGHNFSVSASNVDYTAVSFVNHKYNTTTNKQSFFSMYDQFIKAWCKKNNKADSALSFVQLIELQRDAFLMKSMNSLGNYTIGLSLDEVLQNLLATGKIKPVHNNNVNEYNQGVPVEFVIQARAYSQALETIMQVNFHYVVRIPCFTHGDVVSETIQKGCYQSACQQIASKARDVFDDGDDYTLQSNDSASVSKLNRHEYEIDNSKNLDGEEKTVYSEISKIIGNNHAADHNVGDKSCVESVQTKW